MLASGSRIRRVGDCRRSAGALGEGRLRAAGLQLSVAARLPGVSRQCLELGDGSRPRCWRAGWAPSRSRCARRPGARRQRQRLSRSRSPIAGRRLRGAARGRLHGERAGAGQVLVVANVADPRLRADQSAPASARWPPRRRSPNSASAGLWNVELWMLLLLLGGRAAARSSGPRSPGGSRPSADPRCRAHATAYAQHPLAARAAGGVAARLAARLAQSRQRRARPRGRRDGAALARAGRDRRGTGAAHAPPEQRRSVGGLRAGRLRQRLAALPGRGAGLDRAGQRTSPAGAVARGGVRRPMPSWSSRSTPRGALALAAERRDAERDRRDRPGRHRPGGRPARRRCRVSRPAWPSASSC